MEAKDTPEKAIDFRNGNSPYQHRARLALPILVNQAKAGKTILYGQLGPKVGLSNVRNLNYVLGSIGTTLRALGRSFGKIPPIQCLVVNQATGRPGAGVDWFIGNSKSLGKKRKETIEEVWEELFAFRRWDELLECLELSPDTAPTSEIPQELLLRHLNQAARRTNGRLEKTNRRQTESFLYPDEKELEEGNKRSCLVNKYERNPEARKKCLQFHGRTCAICDADVAKSYGLPDTNLLHVHHLKPVSKRGGRYFVNPKTDLIPVCPNCHAAIHSRIPPFTPEQVRRLRSASRNS